APAIPLIAPDSINKPLQFHHSTKLPEQKQLQLSPTPFRSSALSASPQFIQKRSRNPRQHYLSTHFPFSFSGAFPSCGAVPLLYRGGDPRMVWRSGSTNF